jgi:hypothetical protein
MLKLPFRRGAIKGLAIAAALIAGQAQAEPSESVSYTHLTLPTM